jgi:hypothetical protein
VLHRTDKPLAAQVVAGHEPELTNLFLQQLGKLASTTDGADAVRRVLAGEHQPETGAAAPPPKCDPASLWEREEKRRRRGREEKTLPPPAPASPATHSSSCCVQVSSCKPGQAHPLEATVCASSSWRYRYGEPLPPALP